MTRKNHRQALFVVAILLLGIVWLRAHTVRVARQQRGNIYEAVLRYVGKDYTQRNFTKEKALFFVSINWHDPAPSFFKRFEDGEIEVLPASRGVSDHNGRRSRTTDKQSQRPGSPISLYPVEWQSASGVRVRADFSQGGTFYFLKKQNGQWTVFKTDTALVV